MKKHLLTKTCLFLVFLIWTQVGWGQTPYLMSGGNYSENFADIANWTNNFAAGVGASSYGAVAINATGAIPDGVKTTKSSATFVATTTGGIQKGTENLVFLSTGALNANSVAVDLLLDFTGKVAGTLSFDWATVDNTSPTKSTSLRVYTSIDGSAFTELASAAIVDKTHPSSGSITTVNLPASFNNSATARIRFYNYGGDNTGSGNRPKISIDNISVTNAPPDVTAPVWTATYPKTANVLDSKADLTVNTDEPGTAYYVVLPDGATAPSNTQVVAGQDATSTPVTLKGSITITAATTDYTTTITGLTPSTSYDIYVVAQDDESTPNVSAPVLKDITTLADNTAPTWTATYPKAANIANTQFDLLTNLNEAGVMYYVVLQDGKTAPSVAQVKAFTDGTDVAAYKWGTQIITAGTTEFVKTISGMADGATYDVYVVAEDDVPNVQTTVASVLDIALPALKAEPSEDVSGLAVGAVTSTSVTINWTDAGGAVTPDGYMIQIKSGGAWGAPADGLPYPEDLVFDDGGTVYVANGVETYTFTGLSVGSTYEIRVVSHSNFGANINYKTDAIPTVSANTTYIELLTPNGGQTFFAGDNVNITWTSVNMASENIKIEAKINTGAEVYSWIEIAASETNDGLFSYTIPASTNYGIGYKIRITGITSNTADSSDLAFTVIAVAPNIAALRSIPAGDEVKYTGEAIVTFTQTFRNQKYIQDATGAILIDDNTNVLAKAWVKGDKVSNIRGNIGINNGNTQIIPSVAGENAISSGNVVTPVVVSVTDINTNFETYESQLVKVVNIGFSSVGSFANGAVYNYSDIGSVAGTFRTTFYDVDYIGTAIPTTRVTITGILNSRTTTQIGNHITARDLADFASAVATVTSSVYTVDQGAFTITNIPYSTSLAAFKVNITPATGATWNVFDTDGTTPATVLDNTKKLIVTAADDITKSTYTITRNAALTDASLSDLKVSGTTITGFATTTYNYVVTLPYGTTATPAVTVTTTDANANPVITPATNILSATIADRTTTVTVTAEDGTTTLVYNVIFNVTPALTGKSILTYSFAEQTGPATIGDGTIAVEVSNTTDRSNLIATFTISEEATIAIGATPQVSGTTANDFTSPVTYVVTAQDASTKDWVVTVTNAATLSDATDFLTFSVLGVNANVNTTNHTVTAVLPYGTDRTALVATFTYSTGATVKVGATAQVSGTTPNNFTNAVIYTITAEDGATTQDWTVTITNEAPSADASLSDIKVDGTTISGFISATLAYNFELPFGTTATPVVTVATTDVNAVPVITPAADVTSATEANRTTTINVTAQDGVTIKNYAVLFNVNPGNSDTRLYSTVYNINNTYNVINMVPVGTSLATFESNITPAADATFETYKGDSVTVADDLQDGYIVICTAQNGVNTRIYQVMVKPAAGAGDLFFSEYIEGSSNNKALEIFNGTGADVDLHDYVIRINGNGSAWTSIFDFPVGTTLANGDVYVIAHSASIAGILAVADSIVQDPYAGGTSYVAVFNGDDVRGLFKVNGADTTMIDIIGADDLSDPGTAWSVAGIANATQDHTLVRKSSVSEGNVNWASSAGTTIEDSEWGVFAKDSIADLGSHNAAISSNVEANILSFELAEQYSEAVIDTANATVDIEVLFGTDVTTLIPIIEISEGAHIMPPNGYEQNFTAPVVYTVTASDYMTTKDWTVTVTVNPTANDDAEILTFEIADMDSVNINLTDTTITVYMPYGTDVTSLAPTYTISSGATINSPSGTVQNFTTPLIYTVTAQNLTNVMEWEVTVNVVEATEVTIHDIQYTEASPANSPYAGQLVKTKGVVTAAKTGTTTSFYLQDGDGEWDAIYVYGSTTAVEVGDSIQIVAQVSEQYYVTQLSSIVNLTIINSDNTLPEPLMISTLDANSEKYESVLVQVIAAETISGSAGNYVVNDGTGALTVYETLYADFVLTIGKFYDIIGVMTWYNSGSKFEILPRNADDIYEDQVPVISDVTSDPTNPTTTEAVTITAAIVDDFTAPEELAVALYWGTAAGSESNDVTFIQNGFGDTFSGTIPAQSVSTIYYKITANDGYNDDVVHSGSYSITTGINDPASFVSVHIYPNPSNGQFTIELNAQKAGKFDLEIVNVLGQVIYQKQVDQDGTHKDMIDISDKAKGLYYIRITDGTSTKVQKLMIK